MTGRPFSEIIPEGRGRAYRSARRVRLGDVAPSHEVRLDAVARYLHDVAGDDVIDAGISGAAAWVVRRTTIHVVARPAYEDLVDLTTWCSGTGAAWAERRTTIAGDGRSLIEASSLWVCLDPVSARPMQLDTRFFAAFGQSAKDRQVSSRLRLPPEPPAGMASRPWPLRRSDFDVLGHVNNAIAWSAIEEEASRIQPLDGVEMAELEYRQPIEEGGELRVVSDRRDDLVDLWILDGAGRTAVAAVLRLATASPAPIDPGTGH